MWTAVDVGPLVSITGIGADSSRVTRSDDVASRVDFSSPSVDFSLCVNVMITFCSHRRLAAVQSPPRSADSRWGSGTGPLPPSGVALSNMDVDVVATQQPPRGTPWSAIHGTGLIRFHFPRCTSKCRCGPVAWPVLPSSAIRSPAATLSPVDTSSREA